jgi:hypothetical protein
MLPQHSRLHVPGGEEVRVTEGLYFFSVYDLAIKALPMSFK